jgi:DNA-binding CsgD family transcriptional regulator
MPTGTRGRREALSNGLGIGQSSNSECDGELDRLREAAEWLRGAGPAPEGAALLPAPRFQALVVDLGPSSQLAPDSLRRFSDRFPGIAILVHQRGSQDVERQGLASVIAAFASSRCLSPRQRLILELHLSGKNDKEIAVALGCESTTVYEHWRRMGRKSEGTGKGDVVADFHRYLARGFSVTSEDK